MIGDSMNRFRTAAVIVSIVLCSGCVGSRVETPDDAWSTEVSFDYRGVDIRDICAEFRQIAKHRSGTELQINVMKPSSPDASRAGGKGNQRRFDVSGHLDYTWPVITFSAESVSIRQALEVCAELSRYQLFIVSDRAVLIPCQQQARVLFVDDYKPPPEDIPWPPSGLPHAKGPLILRGRCTSTATGASVPDIDISGVVSHRKTELAAIASDTNGFVAVMLTPWGASWLQDDYQRVRLMSTPPASSIALSFHAEGYLGTNHVLQIDSSNIMYSIDVELTPVPKEE